MSVLRRWWPHGTVAALLGLVAFGAALGSLPLRPSAPATMPTLSVTRAAATANQTAASAPPEDGVALPSWIEGLASVLCLVVTGGLIAFLIFLLLRGRFGGRRPRVGFRTQAAPITLRSTTTSSVVSALDEGIVALDDDDSDPRRAVIACWVRLEAAAGAAGTAREPGDTSTDLVVRLLREHQVSAGMLTEFAEVYRHARYAKHTVHETTRTQARAALRQLRSELMAETGVPHDG